MFRINFIISFNLVYGFITNFKQTATATLPCGNPLEYLVANLNRSSYSEVHSQINVFSEKDEEYLELFSADRNNEYISMLSISFNLFGVASFMQEFYSNKNNRSVQSIALVVPNDLKSSVDIFNQISLRERRTEMWDGRKPKIFIVIPDICNTSNCFLNEVLHFPSPVTLPPISTEMYLLQCYLNGTLPQGSWNISVIYSVGYEHLLQSRDIEFNSIYNPYSVRWNFSLAKLRSTIPEGRLKEEFNFERQNGSVKLINGLGVDVVIYLEDALNFKMDYIVTGNWVKKPNALSSAELSRQFLDNDTLQILTVAKTTFLPIRKELFGFLVPHYVEGVRAFFRQPPASSMRNIFKEPFKLDLWGTIIVVWFLVGFSAILAAKIKSGYQQLDDADREISKDSLLWAIAFTCQQGWHIDPESISIKIIFLCGSAMGLIIYVAYSAALVSALSSVVTPVKTFDDLLYTDFTFTYEPDSQTIESILKGSSCGGDEISGAEGNLIRRKTISKPAKEGVEAVFSSNLAYMSFSDFFYSVAKNELNTSDLILCSQVSYVKVSKVPFRSGMVVKKMSPYKEFFNIRLITMYENGLLQRYLINYRQGFLGSCDTQRHKNDLGLGLNDVFTAYVIILSGYALSFTVFLIEKLHYKNYKIHQMENQMADGNVDIFDPHLAY